MKKYVYFIISAFVFYSCVLQVGTKDEVVMITENLSYEKKVREAEQQPLNKNPEKKSLSFFDKIGEQHKEAAVLPEDVKEVLEKEVQDNYAYGFLGENKREVYLEILYALKNRIKGIELSAKNTEMVDEVFQCVLLDHPELFYTDGYSFVKYTMGEEVRRIIFQGNYIYKEDEIMARQVLIEEKAEDIISNVPVNASDYEKVKYIYETVISDTEYSMEAKDNQNICSVLLGGASVCQGYAKTVQYLLNRLSIPTTLVVGTVEGGEGHAWNLVKLQDEYYYVDATWGDASYFGEKQEDEALNNRENMEVTGENDFTSINYDYLCITTQELEKTHAIDHIVPVPVCTSMEDNYYVVEGAYFTEFNEEQFKKLLERYQQEGRKKVTLKCDDDVTYEEVTEKLLEEQAIFHYLEGEGTSIAYTDSREHLSLTFWL